MRIEPYALPLVRALPAGSGLLTHRRGWLVALEDAAGRVGWGDAACWPGFGSSEEAVATRLGALAHGGRLEGALPESTLEDAARCLGALAIEPEVRFAMEIALADLMGQRLGCSIAELLGAESSCARSHALVLDQVDARAIHLKIKVGADLDAAEARVAAVRAAARPGARLRVDAGGRWDEALAREALVRLARYGLEWLEQPLGRGELEATARLRKLAQAHGVGIALDESIGSLEDLEAALSAEAADAVVLKPMFLGGLCVARAAFERARRAGVTAIVTNALESAVGRTGVLHLAAALPGVHGLSNALARDVATAPERSGDRIPLPAGTGLGVRPERAAAARRSARSIAVPNPLAGAALARPDHPALVSAERVYNYRELAEAAARAASQLRARGIAPGMTVALAGARDARWVVAWHAIAWLGAVAAPLAHDAPEHELERQLAALGPDARLDTGELDLGGEALTERDWPLEAPRAVLLTSGSTGAPRAVTLTTAQLLLSAFGSALRLGHLPSDRWLCCLPLHHVGGLSILVRSALAATTVLLHERFDPARVAQALDGGEATLVSLVPTMLERVLDARPERPFPSSVRAILLGGAAASPELLARAAAIGAPVAPSWGMTEAASQIATRFAGDLDAEGGVGPPLAFARVDALGGRLRVRGPLVGGCLETGDRGAVDASGRVQVHGRLDACIVSGGEKIDPLEIEDVLRAHDDVAEAAVVGVASAAWGERPVAAIVPSGDRLPALAELRAHCRARLSAFKAPDEVVWCARLPKGALGKVSRARVRELVVEVLADRARAGGSVDEAVGAKSLEEGRRGGSGREGVERNEGVLELGARAHRAVVPAQRVGEGDGTLAAACDGELDGDALVHADGRVEVGLRMHQGHAHTLAFDERVDAAADGEQELLVGGVAVLEHAPEKDDAGAIDLVKANGHPMNERHGDERR